MCLHDDDGNYQEHQKKREAVFPENQLEDWYFPQPYARYFYIRDVVTSGLILAQYSIKINTSSHTRQQRFLHPLKSD